MKLINEEPLMSGKKTEGMRRPGSRLSRRYPQLLESTLTANMAEGTSAKLANVSDVEIDANGRFKYVLIKVIDKSQGGVFKYVVRGFDWADYHGRLCDRYNERALTEFK